jgi:hypothetical protein
VEYLLSSQFQQYVDKLEKSTCLAETRRLLTRGPPINISVRFPPLSSAFSVNDLLHDNVQDPICMPCGVEGKDEVHALWYSSSNETKSAQLAGALTGDARTKYWEEQKAFRLASAAAEGDAEASAGDKPAE